MKRCRQMNRRKFLASVACSTGAIGGVATLSAAKDETPAPVIDTHMHVWSDDPVRFPFAHPYDAKHQPPSAAASVEVLLKEMDEFGVSHCVLVQMISHGWDNRYL